MLTLQRGDKIRTPGRIGLIWHYGIYLGIVNGVAQVIHNSKVAGRVVIEPLHLFNEGRPIYLDKRPAPERVEAVIDAACAWQGTQYDLFSFNCETFANAVHDGQATSHQVQWGTALGTLAVMWWLGSRPTYDAYVDRYRDKRGRFAK